MIIASNYILKNKLLFAVHHEKNSIQEKNPNFLLKGFFLTEKSISFILTSVTKATVKHIQEAQQHKTAMEMTNGLNN